ncbi:hypothetical protein FNU76_01830 [Chitinimonas arctica]|uniref:Uncharacterized protein n=1 Tax=Chitinimonas arctica TaxID=2594795 RepID=A0A516SAL8_9NEIS|nr:hypothetical protein FNU76_01830 [Chitinimonas arctica]
MRCRKAQACFWTSVRYAKIVSACFEPLPLAEIGCTTSKRLFRVSRKWQAACPCTSIRTSRNSPFFIFHISDTLLGLHTAAKS